MEVFLSECKEKLSKASDNQKIKIVLGNEACDLDSAVSSLVLAFSLSQANASKERAIILPVLNVLKKDIRLHSEVAFFLEETSINLEYLICKDEIDIKRLADAGRLRVVLVDHNVLSSEYSYLLPYVELIFDHHVIENPKKIEHCKSVIEPVGSCCTLIAEHVFNTEPSSIDPHAAMLLYGTIVLDTVCLDENAKRVTEKDRQMVTKLETVLEGISRQEVFQALQKAKFDVTGFSPQQLLQKDLKVVTSGNTSIAIASIPTLLDDLTNGTSMEPVLQEFTSSGQYQSVILMGSHISKDGKSIRRHLAVFSPKREFVENLSNFLKNLENPSLALEPLSTSSQSIVLFEQKNTTLTRKFVFPAIQNYLEQSHNAGIENDIDGVSDRSDVNSLVESGETAELSAHNYQLETVDFPDSPNHASLLKNMLQDSCEIKDGSLQVDQPKSLVNSLKGYGGGDTDSPGSARRKIYIHPSVLREDSVNDDQKSLSSLSNKSEPDVFSPTEDIVLPEEDDDIDTPEELEISDVSVGLESTMSEPIPEMSAAEEYEEERSWKMCVIGGEEKRIDMRVIEPYKKVLSHGGYHGETRNAIIIFSACYLPDRSRKDYDYVMDNLFLYVLSTLDQLVAEDYILVYLHGATERGNMPGFGWLKRCYRMIDRRLRKNLKGLYLVHPTFWLKTIVIMTRPFISSKFSRKLKFVNTLEELSSLIPMDHVCIPDKVKSLDFERMIKIKKKQAKYKKFTIGPTYSLSAVERY